MAYCTHPNCKHAECRAYQRGQVERSLTVIMVVPPAKPPVVNQKPAALPPKQEPPPLPVSDGAKTGQTESIGDTIWGIIGLIFLVIAGVIICAFPWQCLAIAMLGGVVCCCAYYTES